MKTFKDATGRTWTVAINTTTAQRVRDLTDINPFDMQKFNEIYSVLRDPIQLVALIYALCKPEIDERNLTPEQFGESLDGQSLRDAWDAFEAELIFFIRALTPGDGDRLQLTLDRLRSLDKLATEKLTEQLKSSKLDESLELEISKAFNSTESLTASS